MTKKLPISVLHAASEATPLVKTGGLADVVGALPTALRSLGVDARIILPAYPSIDHNQLKLTQAGQGTIKTPTGAVRYAVQLSQLPDTDVPLYLVSLSRGLTATDVYPKPRQGDQDRFPLFCLAVADWLNQSSWQPSIIHCHDWMTSLLPFIVNDRRLPYKTILTIHNLAYQGKTSHDTLAKAGLGHVSNNQVINLLKIGITSASRVNTVSPTYAREVLSRQYGEGLQSVLKSRQKTFSGILNGIDYDRFTPQPNPYIDPNYTRQTVINGKHANKQRLQRQLNLTVSNLPLLAMVGRLDQQKGFDLVIEAAHQLQLWQHAQLVILGQGKQKIERQVRRLAAKKHPNISVNIAFDEGLAHRIYAASDFFLIPSYFEPCGLTQMIAMRFGSIPIVRRTGGLADTVVDIDQDAKQGTGIVFDQPTSDGLSQALRRALDLYAHPDQMKSVIYHGMQQDFSWPEPARQYARLYQQALS